MRLIVSLFLGIALLSCTSKVPQVGNIPSLKRKGYCLRGYARWKGRLEQVRVCTETYSACLKATEIAKRYGGFAEITQVDQCRME